MTTTLLESVDTSRPDQYLYLENVSWECYEMLAVAADDRRLQITYDQGRMEIMSPLPRHERVKTILGSMIQLLAMEREIEVDGLGSTTLSRQLLEKGVEPDECYYIQNYEKIWEKDELNLEVDPPPDLVIEVENTTRIIQRLPIYVALGVPEIWRHDGLRLTGLALVGGTYQPTESSVAFPFLKIDDLNQFLHRATLVRKNQLLLEFRDWVRKGI